MSWNEIDLAYLAGFIDGEGSISIFRSGNRDHCMFNIYNTNELIMLWLKQMFEGNVCQLKRTRNEWKQEYSWYIGPQKASLVLKACLPYLKLKKRHAELFIAYTETSKGRAGKSIPPEILSYRNEILEEMKFLNKRGTSDSTPRT